MMVMRERLHWRVTVQDLMPEPDASSSELVCLSTLARKAINQNEEKMEIENKSKI